MRRDLAGRAQAFGLRAASSSTDSLRGEVHEVQRLVLVRGEREVARDHQRLGDRRIAGEAELGGDRALVHLPVARERRLLLVQRQPAVRDRRVLERAPHEARASGRDDRRR